VSVKTVRSNDFRIPAAAREALERHEEVLVVSHDRPVFVISSASDHPAGAPMAPRGRRLVDAVALLTRAPFPDGEFGTDLESVRAATGPVPPDPWAPS